MGLRKYKRQIAKARMAAAGVGNVNKKMHIKDSDGVPNWRKALTKKGEKAQIEQAWKVSRARQLAKRKFRRIDRTA